MDIAIYQIGAGGTGSWFARILAHGIASRFADVPEGRIHPFHKGLNLTWGILDPDTIEIKNQARQLFLGTESIGTPKAIYLSRMVNMILAAGLHVPGTPHLPYTLKVTPHVTLVQSDTVFPDLWNIGRTHKESRAIVVSCVDNTYTRNLLEEALISRRDPEDDKVCYRNTVWIDMGVSEDNSWISFAAYWQDVCKTKYSQLTDPDAMLSCAERQERGPSPQTTFANCCAGAHAAQIALDYICDPDPFFGAFVVGNGHRVNDLATDKASFRQLLEDITK